ncbi:hypothetical protein RM550_17070 [Streptomyces sp. DSM 41527]|uniref:Uncharacterized protein n=1 Tax=Streptomyces mooreae TaxID=3075523 RepID=A0ABU2T933_9ACTN|nr:hypothetical protein [Streptomyces sp. DSM 41527]MDT0457428.1 hypothetical protein [Streptomyces sp. DSM 41527]
MSEETATVIAAGITAVTTLVGLPAVFMQARAASKAAQVAREAAQATRDAGRAQAEAVYRAALDGARTNAQGTAEQWRREQRRDTWTEFLHNADHVEYICTSRMHTGSPVGATESTSDVWRALQRSLVKLELVSPGHIGTLAHDVVRALSGLVDDHHFTTGVAPVFERLNAMWAEAHPRIRIGPGEDWPTCPPDHPACAALAARADVQRLGSTARAAGMAQPLIEAEEAIRSGEVCPYPPEEGESLDERSALLRELYGAYGDLGYALDGVPGLPELDEHLLMTRVHLDRSEFHREHESRIDGFGVARSALLLAAQEEIVGTAS